MPKIMRFTLLLFAGVLSVFFSYSQNTVTILGNAKSYAGYKLELKRYADFITNRKMQTSICTVDSAGDFKFSFQAAETALYALPLGVFEGLFYAEAGDSLILVLPKRTMPDKQDSLNPFFKPQKHFLRNLNASEDDLTTRIKAFEIAYQKEMSQLFEAYAGRLLSGKVDSAVMRLEYTFASDDIGFFYHYKYYRYAEMRHAAYERNRSDFVAKYFVGRPVLYNNPAYHDALSLAVGNMLKTSELNRLFEGENSKLRQNLNNRLAEDSIFGEQRLREYVLLINLYRTAFKQDDKRQEYILLFEQIQKNTFFAEHKAIAAGILEELSGLINGNPAPNFCLKNPEGEQRCLSDFRGSFVYLNFFSESSYTGNKELALLQALQLDKLPGLEIVSIYTGDSYEKFKQFTNERAYDFEFLYAPEDHSVINDYRVMRYPEYYLIHPNGKILLISAPSPASNFRATYGPYYTEWNREQIRRKARENKSLINE
jgi:peroxiredoxin